MNKEQFLSVLEALQGKVSNIEFVLQNKHCKVNAERGQLIETPYYANTRLIMESPGGRFRYEDDSATEWVGDDGKLKQEPAKGASQRVFDGRIGVHATRSRAGVFSYYEVSVERCPENDRRVMMMSAYLELFAPYYNDMGLAQFLRTCDTWELAADGHGAFVVRYVLERFPEDQRIRELTVDLERGAAITHIRHFWKSSGEVTKEYDVTVKRATEGLWFPEHVDERFLEYGEVYKLTFSSVAVNQMLPEDGFTLKFEPGATVDDRVYGTRYTVGHETDGDLMRFVDSGLAQVEGEDKSAASGSGAEPSSRPAETGQREQPGATGNADRILLIVAIALAALALLVVGVVLYRKGTKGPVDLGMLLALAAVVEGVILPPMALAQATGSGYERDYFGKRIPVFQCGLFCTVVQLRHFGRRVNVDTLKTHLACTSTGTDFDAVKSSLEAYGLDVTPVKGLRVSYLTRYLMKGGTAIIAIGGGGNPEHFLCVIGRREDFTVLDFPSKRRTMDSKTMEAKLSMRGGLALLVADSARKPSETGQIVVDPETVDVGEIKPVGPPPEAQLTVANRGTRAMVIADFRAACGCMQIEASSRWLEPGDVSTVKCRVSPQRWGSADKKTLYINFGDGGVRAVVIKGRLTELSVAEAVSVDPGAIYVSEAQFAHERYVSRTVRLVMSKGKNMRIISLATTADWISVTQRHDTASDNANEAELLVRVEKSLNYGTPEGAVVVGCEDITDPVRITVRQDRPYPFRTVPKVLHFTAGGENEKVIEISPVDATSPFEIVSVAGAGKLVSVEYPSGSLKGKARLVVRANGYEEKQWSVLPVEVRVKQGDAIVALPISLLLQNGY